MKIGILTLPLHYNYGGILQAYALQKIIERMGHDVEVIDKDFSAHLAFNKRPLTYFKRAVKKYVLRKECYVFSERRTNYEMSTFCIHTSLFVKKYIRIRKIKALKEISSEDYDAIIVGSDQIWRMYYFKMFFGNKCTDAFLMFTKNWNIKRISYAPSFGTDKIELSQEEINECKPLMQSFNGISVREKSGVEICKNSFGVNAKWVLDPTMLLSAIDYLILLNGTTDKKTHNLVTYILDPTIEKDKIVNFIARDKKINIVKTNSEVDNNAAKLEDRIQPSVESWIKYISGGEFIVTDSYHACVFSILFHKPFAVIGNKKRGMARFESLLEMFGLKETLIYSVEEYKMIPEIDFTSVDAILNKKRKEALNFLSKSLE